MQLFHVRRALASVGATASLAVAGAVMVATPAHATQSMAAAATTTAHVAPYFKRAHYNTDMLVEGKVTDASGSTISDQESDRALIQRRYKGSSRWVTIKKGDPGYVSVFVHTTHTAYFRVVYLGGTSYDGTTYRSSTSGVRGVAVTRKIGSKVVKRHGKLFLRGTLHPKHRTKLFLQRKNCKHCKWHRVDKFHTNRHGHYSHRLRTKRHGRLYYRVFTKRTSAFVKSYSDSWYTYRYHY